MLFNTEDGTPTIGDVVPDGATIVWEDNDEKTVTLTRQGDQIIIDTIPKKLQAIFDANAEEAANFNATGSLGNMVKVANIPNDLYWAWRAEGLEPHEITNRLNDGDWAKLRTNSLRL